MSLSTKKVLTIGSLVATVLFFQTNRGDAHHSEGSYDSQTTITVSGVVKEFQYVNPHSWLIVQVAGEDGSLSTWGFEGDPPLRLLRSAGVRRGDLPPGARVTVTAHPLRDGRPAGRWIRIVKEDGTTFSVPRPQDVRAL